MNWVQNDGFISTSSNSLEELNIISKGCFRFVDKNKNVANAVLYDKVCCKYRLGYLYEFKTGENRYKFKCNSGSQYTVRLYRQSIFRLWCAQKMEYGM